MTMRGIEGMPIVLIAVALLLLIVSYVGFTQIKVFLSFNEKRAFKEDVSTIVQEMKLLKATGNSGSFTTKSFKIPVGYSMSLDLDNETIATSMPDEVYNVSLSQISLNLLGFKGADNNITRNGTLTLSGSDVTLVLHYGDLPDSQMRLFTLTFE